MERISEAVLSKVGIEAQNIIKEAEEKAGEEIERAKKQRERRFEELKRKQIERAERDAARVLAQASIKARQELLNAKVSVIDRVINGVRDSISTISSNEGLLSLIKEAIDGLGVDKARIYVSPKDVNAVQGILKENRDLADRVAELREFDSSGGVIAEDIDAKVRIDNTYETRLEILLPGILPEISKELFEDL